MRAMTAIKVKVEKWWGWAAEKIVPAGVVGGGWEDSRTIDGWRVEGMVEMEGWEEWEKVKGSLEWRREWGYEREEESSDESLDEGGV